MSEDQKTIEAALPELPATASKEVDQETIVAEEPTVLEVSTEGVTEEDEKREDEKKTQADKNTQTAFDKIREASAKQFEEWKENNEFDIEKIEWEDEEKLIAKITDEDLKVFDAASDNLFKDMDIKTYIQMAKDDIMSWQSLEANRKEGLLDEEDMPYYEASTNSKDQSRILLMTIQTEVKKLKEDFESSHIAEETIRVGVIKTLAEMTVSKFRLTDSWLLNNDQVADTKRIKNIDKSEKIVSLIEENMYMPTLFHLQVCHLDNMRYYNPRYNIFSPRMFNKCLDKIVHGVSTYVLNSESEQNSLTVGRILDKDFKAMNFIKPIIAYCSVKEKSSIFPPREDEEKTKEDQTILAAENLLAPARRNAVTVMNISAAVEKLADSMSIYPETLVKLENMYLRNFKADPLFKKLDATKLELDNFRETCIMISDLIPDLTENTIMKWGDAFAFTQKYFRWHAFRDTNTMLQYARLNKPDEVKVVVFNKLLSPLLEDYFMALYCEIVEHVADQCRTYDKGVRKMMFSTIMNSLILQHEFAFKTKLNEGDMETLDNGNQVFNGEKLLKRAKEFFGDRYEFLIGSAGADIKETILANVDLIQVKQFYLDTVLRIVNVWADHFETLEHSRADICHPDFFEAMFEKKQTSKKKHFTKKQREKRRKR